MVDATVVALLPRGAEDGVGLTPIASMPRSGSACVHAAPSPDNFSEDPNFTRRLRSPSARPVTVVCCRCSRTVSAVP